VFKISATSFTGVNQHKDICFMMYFFALEIMKKKTIPILPSTLSSILLLVYQSVFQIVWRSCVLSSIAISQKCKRNLQHTCFYYQQSTHITSLCYLYFTLNSYFSIFLVYSIIRFFYCLSTRSLLANQEAKHRSVLSTRTFRLTYVSKIVTLITCSHHVFHCLHVVRCIPPSSLQNVHTHTPTYLKRDE
jgi:hypothetical protein